MILDPKYDPFNFSIELYVVKTCRSDPRISSYDVLAAYEGVIEHYVAEQRDRPPRHRGMSDVSGMLMAEFISRCEQWLGRAERTTVWESEFRQLAMPEVLDCMRRLTKSVKFWTSTFGDRAYLEYVSEFIPPHAPD
jgi:hypothetical protein